VNNKTTSYLSPKLESRPNQQKGGVGVFAREAVQAGELLVVWGGDVVNGERLEQLPTQTRQHTIQVEENLYLMPIRPPEPADYVNHSCDPNAGLSGQIVLLALRNIEPGEEICFDYATCDGSPYDEFICECGTPNCRGRVTGNDWSRPELWERYAGYFSPYLQRRIERLKQSLPVDRRNGHIKITTLNGQSPQQVIKHK
jgi:hypothetical protein